MDKMFETQSIIEKLEHGLMVCEATETTIVHLDKRDAKKVLKLLKEQEAVEPIAIKKEMFNEFYGAVACCPKCDCLWIMYMDNMDKDMHYCPECGKEVKWE